MASILAGIDLVISVTGASAFKKLQKDLRDLRLDFLGFEQMAMVLGRVSDAFDTMAMTGVSALQAMVAPAMAFDNTMTQIGALAGFTAEQTERLAQTYLELSTVLPLSAQQLAEVGSEAVRAGAETHAALESIALVSSKLATIAPDLTEAQAAKHLIAISTQFGQTGDKLAGNVGRLGDAFAAMDKVGIGTSGELANIVKRFGFMSAQLGISQEDTLAFAAALRQAGIQTEVAGTAMQQFLGRMAAQTGRFASAAGLQRRELEEMLSSGRGLSAVMSFLGGVQQKTGGDIVKVQRELSKLGVRGSRLQNVMLGLITSTDVFQKALDAAKNTTGTLDRTFDMFSTSMTMQFKTMVGAWQNAAMAFGMTLKPILVPFMKAMTTIAEVLIALPTPVKFLITALIGLTVALMTIASFVLVIVAGFFTLISTTFFLISALYAMRGAISEGIQDLREYARALRTVNLGTLKAGVATEVFAKKIEGLPGPMQGVFWKARDLQNAMVPVIQRTLSWGFLLKVVGVAAIKFVAIVGLIVLAMVAMRSEIEDLFAAFKEMLTPIGELFVGLTRIAGAIDPSGKGSLGTAFMGLVRFALAPFIVWLKIMALNMRLIGAVFQGVTDTILAGFEPLIATFARFRLSIAHAIEFFTVWGQRFGLISKEGSLLKTVLAGIATAVRFLLTPFYLLFRFVAFQFSAILAIVVGVIEGVLRAFAPLFDTFYEIFREVRAVFNELSLAFAPIMDAFGQLLEAIGLSGEGFDVFGVIVQAIAFVVRVSLMPLVALLRVFAIGVKGIVYVFTALGNIAVPVIRAISRVLTPVIKMIASLFKIMGSGRSLMTALSDGVKKFFEGLGDTFQSIFNFFVSIPDSIIELIRLLSETVKGALIDMFAGLAGPLQAALTPLMDMVNAMIAGFNLLPGPDIPMVSMPAMASGGITTGTGVAMLHPQEAVIPLRKLPDLASRFQPYQPTAVSQPAAAPAPAARAPDANLSITIPVTVMLEDAKLGQVVVRVSEEEIRRQFGSRGVRLAGIG